MFASIPAQTKPTAAHATRCAVPVKPARLAIVPATWGSRFAEVPVLTRKKMLPIAARAQTHVPRTLRFAARALALQAAQQDSLNADKRVLTPKVVWSTAACAIRHALVVKPALLAYANVRPLTKYCAATPARIRNPTPPTAGCAATSALAVKTAQLACAARPHPQPRMRPIRRHRQIRSPSREPTVMVK